jgi:hypothetical protein
MSKKEFTRQLADLTGLELGSDDLATCHQKLAAAVGAGLYSEKILETARRLAAARIHSERYKAAFNTAIDEGRALPSQRPLLQRFFVRDPEGAIALVRGLKPVRSVTLRRRAPDGVDPRSFDLDQRIRAHAVQHGIPYAAAFDRVLGTAA